MKKIFYLLLLFIFTSFLIFADSSYIQINCPSEFDIYLNGKYIGQTNKEENGKIIGPLSSGNYNIKISKISYDDVVYNIVLEQDETQVLKVSPGVVSYKIENLDEDNSKIVKKTVGTLKLRSLPVDTKIYINGKSIGNSDIKISDFPVGQHKVTFEKGNKILSTNINLENSDTLSILADFISNTITVKSLLENERIANEEKLRARELEQKKLKEIEFKKKQEYDRVKSLINETIIRIKLTSVWKSLGYSGKDRQYYGGLAIVPSGSRQSHFNIGAFLTSSTKDESVYLDLKFKEIEKDTYQLVPFRYNGQGAAHSNESVPWTIKYKITPSTITDLKIEIPIVIKGGASKNGTFSTKSLFNTGPKRFSCSLKIGDKLEYIFIFKDKDIKMSKKYL